MAIPKLKLKRNKAIVRTYYYWFHEIRLREDDVIRKLEDAFFMTSHTIMFLIIKKTELTKEELLSIDPVIRIKTPLNIRCPKGLDKEQTAKFTEYHRWLEKDQKQKSLTNKFESL